jgi:hypothetical protein
VLPPLRALEAPWDEHREGALLRGTNRRPRLPLHANTLRHRGPVHWALLDLDEYAYYLLGITILILLIYAFRQVEHNERNLEKLVDEKSRRLIEAERLANIGEGGDQLLNSPVRPTDDALL